MENIQKKKIFYSQKEEPNPKNADLEYKVQEFV